MTSGRRHRPDDWGTPSLSWMWSISTPGSTGLANKPEETLLAHQPVVDRSHEIALGGLVLTPRLGLVLDRTKTLNAL